MGGFGSGRKGWTYGELRSGGGRTAQDRERRNDKVSKLLKLMEEKDEERRKKDKERKPQAIGAYKLAKSDSLIDFASELLDEIIEKGERIENEGSILKKSISFNPLRPHLMTHDSPYYSPYKILSDGSFAPYPTEHWIGLGRDASGYRTTDAFYATARGHKFMKSVNIEDLYKVIPSSGNNGRE